MHWKGLNKSIPGVCSSALETQCGRRCGPLKAAPGGGAVSPHLGGIVKAHLNVQMRANLALAGSP